MDVRLEIEGEYKIPKDSRVEVKAAGLLGGMVAEVIPGLFDGEGRPGATGIPGASGIGLFDKMDTLAGQADKVAVKVQDLLSDETVKDLQGGAAGRPPVAREPAGDPEGAAGRAAGAHREPEALRRGHGEGHDRAPSSSAR